MVKRSSKTRNEKVGCEWELLLTIEKAGLEVCWEQKLY